MSARDPVESMPIFRGMRTRFDGAILSREWKEALWDKFVTAAPRSRCPTGECLHSPRGAHAVRAAIQRSQASLSQLSRELGINPMTVARWRKRADGAALDGSDGSRRSGNRRVPAPNAPSAGRLPLCPAAVYPAFDTVSPASLPATTSASMRGEGDAPHRPSFEPCIGAKTEPGVLPLS